MRCWSVIALLVASCANLPTPPEQPRSGPGGASYIDGDLTITTVGEGAGEIRIYEPTLRDDGDPLPLVVFLHGYQALSEGYYSAWLRHLTLHAGPATPTGSVVIFPIFQERWTNPSDFTPNAAEGIETALAHLRDMGHAVDLERVIFVGHSGGSVVGANLSTWSVDGRLPLKPKGLIMVAPGRCVLCDQFSDPGIPMEPVFEVPASMALIVMNSSGDEVVGTELGRAYFDQLTQIPRSRRTYLEIRNDDFGGPSLRANHRVAAANPDSRDQDWVTDALDFYGTWKITDAMMSCLFTSEDCDTAFGEGHAQKFMGLWSDGTPVNPMRNRGEP